jgi:hypothetical protein
MGRPGEACLAPYEQLNAKRGATAVAKRPRFRSFALSRDRNPRSGIPVLRTNYEQAEAIPSVTTAAARFCGTFRFFS